MAERAHQTREKAASERSGAAFPHACKAPVAPPAPAFLAKDAPGVQVLRKRSDFLAAARARRQPVGSMLVQARDRRDGDPAIRVGFTCSKKVGNAVARNRAKRRLREAARAELPALARPGWDYVLIGRREATAERPFDKLCADLAFALRKLHEGKA